MDIHRFGLCDRLALSLAGYLMSILYWVSVLLATGFILWRARRANVGPGTSAFWVHLTLAHGLLFKPLFMQLEYPSRELIELTLLPKISFEESIVANATGFKVRSRGMSRGVKYDGSIMDIHKLYDVDEVRALGGIVDYTVGPPLIKVFVLAEHEADAELREAALGEVHEKLLGQHVDRAGDLRLGLRGRLGDDELVDAAECDQRDHYGDDLLDHDCAPPCAR